LIFKRLQNKLALVGKYCVYSKKTKMLKEFFSRKDESAFFEIANNFVILHYNPNQNYKHLKTLANLLGLKDNQVHSFGHIRWKEYIQNRLY